MAESDNIKQMCERFGSSAYCDAQETRVANTYREHPKHVASQKAMELSALLSVISCASENIASLNSDLRGALFEHLNGLGLQVLALTELAAER